MKNTIIFIFVTLPFLCLGQGIVVRGSAILNLKEGAELRLVNDGDFLNEDNDLKTSTITIDGHLYLSGTWNNNSSTLLNLGYDLGTVYFNGTNQQEINGNSLTVFPSVQVNNDVQLGINSQIKTSLIFNSGDFLLSNFDLKMLTGSTISGYGSNYNIVTNGSGKLSQYLTSGGSQITFPVATETSYTPAYISQQSGNSSFFHVRLIDGVWSEGTTGTNLALTEPVVNRTWLITSDETPDANIELQWNGSDEVNGFDRTVAYGADYDGAWQNNTTSVSGTDPYLVSFSDIDNLDADHPHTLGDENEPLPVELLYFEAISTDNATRLRWATASEENITSFKLLRSNNYNDWEEISVIAAAGYSQQHIHYEYYDFDNLQSEVMYYRLIELDIEGQETMLSEAKLSKAENSDFISSYYIYNQSLVLLLNSELASQTRIELYNNIGQLCTSHVVSTHAQKVEVNLPKLSSGVYFIKVSQANNQTLTKKISLF